MSSDEPQRQPSEEEMQAALQEELKKVRVEQVVLESSLSILNVAIMRAGMMPGTEAERDLDQVRVGIEGVRALLPLVELIAGPEQARPIKDALSQLQLVYVQASEQEGGQVAPGAAPGPGAGAAPQPPERRADDGPGSAQSSGRLWVPGQ